MFQFTRFPLPALCVQAGVTPHYGCWVSPFGDPRIKARSTAPRGLSQPPTSFIGSRRQGIHRWLFVAWKNKDARARYAILKGRCRRDAGRSMSGALELRELRASTDRSPEGVTRAPAPTRGRGRGSGTPSKRNRGQRLLQWIKRETKVCDRLAPSRPSS